MKLFVWDFHGVLEKGNQKVVTIITNNILERFGYGERITDELTEAFYGKKWYEYFEHLLPYEQTARCMELQQACVDHGHANKDIIYSAVKPTDFSHDVLQGVHESPHHQILISNSNPDSLEMFVDSVDIRKFFKDEDQRFGVNVHIERDRKSKAETLQDYLQGRGFKELVTIGDSPGDVRLTSVLAGKSYLYTHPGRDFRECVADFKIRDLREVLKEI